MSEVKVDKEDLLKKCKEAIDFVYSKNLPPEEWTPNERLEALEKIQKCLGKHVFINSNSTNAQEFFKNCNFHINTALITSVLVILCKKYSIHYERADRRLKINAINRFNKNWALFYPDLQTLNIVQKEDQYEIHILGEIFYTNSRGKVINIKQRSPKCDSAEEIRKGIKFIHSYIGDNQKPDIIEEHNELKFDEANYEFENYEDIYSSSVMDDGFDF